MSVNCVICFETRGLMCPRIFYVAQAGLELGIFTSADSIGMALHGQLVISSLMHLAFPKLTL